MLNFHRYKEDSIVIRVTMYGCGKGKASARGRQGTWQGSLSRSSPVLPLRGGSSTVLPALFVGAGMMPSRFCEQPGCQLT